MEKILFTFIIIISTSLSYTQSHGTGLIFNKESYQKVDEVKISRGYGAGLPSRVSLKEYVPPVGDQGDMGTCVGWSTTYNLATMEYAIQMGISDISEISAITFDPYYTYLSVVSDQYYYDCESGMFIWEACEHLLEHGVKRFAYDTYVCGSEITEKIKESNSVLDFTAYYRIYNKEASMEDNIIAVQQALKDKHPVAIGMGLPVSFEKISLDGLFTPVEGEIVRGGHAMTIVGYDDDKYGGCFTVINSWSENWGDQGFFYLKYKDYQQFIWSAYYLESEVKELNSGNGCIYGDCISGYGIFKYNSGDLYEGDFIEGNRAGYGIYFWEDNSFFGGEWEENDRHGKGLYTKNDMSYLSGFWKEGTYNGIEFVKNNINKEIEDEETNFDQINPAELSASLKNLDVLKDLGATNYNECVYGDCENGLGMYLQSANYVYLGYFIDGIFNGSGELYGLNQNIGHIYIGELKDGIQNGTGTYTYPSGAKYFGEWNKGNRSGNGVVFQLDGSYQAGKWLNDYYNDGSRGAGDSNLFQIETPLTIGPAIIDGKLTK